MSGDVWLRFLDFLVGVLDFWVEVLDLWAWVYWLEFVSLDLWASILIYASGFMGRSFRQHQSGHILLTDTAITVMIVSMSLVNTHTPPTRSCIMTSFFGSCFNSNMCLSQPHQVYSTIRQLVATTLWTHQSRASGHTPVEAATNSHLCNRIVIHLHLFRFNVQRYTQQVHDAIILPWLESSNIRSIKAWSPRATQAGPYASAHIAVCITK